MSAKENVNKKYAILGLIVFVVVIAVGMVVMTRPDGTNTLSSKKDFVYVNQGYHGSQSEYPFRDLGQGEIETWMSTDFFTFIKKQLRHYDMKEEETLYKYYCTLYNGPYIPLKECYTDILRDISYAYRELKMPAEDINYIVRSGMLNTSIKYKCTPKLQKKYDEIGSTDEALKGMIRSVFIEFFHVKEPGEEDEEE